MKRKRYLNKKYYTCWYAYQVENKAKIKLQLVDNTNFKINRLNSWWILNDFATLAYMK